MPKLSIEIPVFNGQEFLPELLDSLLRQTLADFEIVICDNASINRAPRTSVKNMRAATPAFVTLAMSGTWGLTQTWMRFI